MLDDAVEEKDGGEKVRLGMVVCLRILRSGRTWANRWKCRSFEETQSSCLRRWRESVEDEKTEDREGANHKWTLREGQKFTVHHGVCETYQEAMDNFLRNYFAVT